MTDFYGDMALTADELITEFGQAGALRRAGAATGDAWNPTPGEDIDYPCTMVVLAYENREIDGTRILSTDKKVLVSALNLAIEPATSDKVTIGGVAHAIIDIQPLSPGGIIVLHQIQARR